MHASVRRCGARQARGVLVARMAIITMTVLGSFALLGCPDTKENPKFYPDKETFEQYRTTYTSGPVVTKDDGGDGVFGHASQVLSLEKAVNEALVDAAAKAASERVIPAIRAENVDAAQFFTTDVETVAKFVRDEFANPERAAYAREEIARGRFTFDLYQEFVLSLKARQKVVAALIEYWQRAVRVPEPKSFPFAVLLTGFSHKKSVQEKVALIKELMERALRELRYPGKITLRDDDGDADSEVAGLKRSMLAKLPAGASVEIALTLDLPQKEPIEKLQYIDIRGRRAPLEIGETPPYKNGKYAYHIDVPGIIVKKDQPALRLEITQATTGHTFVQEHPLFVDGRARFVYTDRNVAVLQVDELVGNIARFFERLQQVAEITDPETGRKQKIRIERPTMIVTSGGTASGGRGTAQASYTIGVNRPDPVSVYVVLAPKNTDYAPSQLEGLDWKVVWEQFDPPPRRYGEIDKIEIEALDQTNTDQRLYVKVVYNTGRNTDYLLYDFRGRQPGEEVNPVTIHTTSSE